MLYKICDLKSLKNNKIQTIILSNIELNPNLMCKIHSIELCLDNRIIDDVFQDIILNSCFYIIKNPEKNFSKFTSQENITDILNKNVFCQIPMFLMDNRKNNDNKNNITSIIFEFDWNKYFSQPLVQIENYILILKFKNNIDDKYIKNYFVHTIHTKFESFEQNLSYKNLKNEYIIYFQSTTICNIYFESHIKKHNTELNLLGSNSDINKKFILRQKCNFNSVTRTFIIKIHKFCYDKLETIQLFFNGRQRSEKLLKHYFDFIYQKRKIQNSDFILLFVPIDFNEKDYLLSSSFEKNIKISYCNFNRVLDCEFEFVFINSTMYDKKIEIISIDLFFMSYHNKDFIQVSNQNLYNMTFEKICDCYKLIKLDDRINYANEPNVIKMEKSNFCYFTKLERNSDIVITKSLLLNFNLEKKENSIDLEDLISYILETKFELVIAEHKFGFNEKISFIFPLYLCEYQIIDNILYIDLLSNKNFIKKYNLLPSQLFDYKINLLFKEDLKYYQLIENVNLFNLMIFIDTDFRFILTHMYDFFFLL